MKRAFEAALWHLSSGGSVIVAAFAVLASCGLSNAETEPEPAPPSPPPIPSSAACDSLDRSECMRALHCTMHHVKSAEYECRPSQGPCETGLIQTDARTCKSRQGCIYDQGSCYCPFPGYGKTRIADKQKNPGGACACGGGPPPRCRQVESPSPTKSQTPPQEGPD